MDWAGTDGGATIGALVTIAELAADTRIGAGYPGLAAAAEELATPQIRRVATRRRKPVAAQPVLVLPASCHELPQEGRDRLPGPVG